MYDEFWEENLRLNPLTATFAGDPRYNAELPNMLSLEYEEQTRAFQQKYLDRARAIVGAQGAESLTGQDRLSYEIFTLNRESELEDLKFPERLLPIDQFYNIANQFAQLGSGTGAQPFATVKDYDDWLQARGARAGDLRAGHAQHARRHQGRHGRSRACSWTRCCRSSTPTSSEDVEKSIFWGPVTDMPAGIQRGGPRASDHGVPQPDRHPAQPRLPQAAHLHRR